MRKQHKLLIASIFTGFLGWLSTGIGYTSTLGGFLNGILFYGGLVMCLIALLLFILSTKE